MSNFINKINKNPYRIKDYRKNTLRIVNKELNSVGVITSEITGEFGDRKAYITTGYEGTDEHTNFFIISKEDLDILISNLLNLYEDITDDSNIKLSESELMYELHSYITNGYIKSITLRKLNIELPGFNPNLYTPFNIEPEFKNDLPDDNINLGLNFVKVLRIKIRDKDYNDMLDYIRNGDKNIPIKFIGFDRNEQIKKYINDAKKELKDFDPSKRKMPTKEQRELALKTLSNIGYKLK